MSENFMKIYRGLSFEPSTVDPVSPLEGDMFFADATHPTRDEGFWQFKDGDWEQFGTGSGGSGGVVLTRDQVTSQTGTTVTFTTSYELATGVLFYRNGVLMDEVTVFSGGVSNAEEYQEATSLTITLNASDPATTAETFEFVAFQNAVTDAALYDARGDADGSLVEDCTISTVLSKTRVILDPPFTYTVGRNPGGAYGDIAIHVNGQRIERKITGINDGVGNIIYDEVDSSTVDIYTVTGGGTDPLPAGIIINASMVQVTASAPAGAGDFFADGSVPMTGHLDFNGFNGANVAAITGSDNADITIGSKLVGTGQSGKVVLESGVTGPSGLITGDTEVRTGESLSANPTGDVLIYSGDSAGGSSGDVILETGQANTTRGSITLKDGSEGTPGDVWTHQAGSGVGAWVTPSAGGALTTTTAKVYVDNSATGSTEDGSIGNPYLELSTALADVAAPASSYYAAPVTILLAPGVYDLNIIPVIDHGNISIVGEGSTSSSYTIEEINTTTSFVNDVRVNLNGNFDYESNAGTSFIVNRIRFENIRFTGGAELRFLDGNIAKTYAAEFKNCAFIASEITVDTFATFTSNNPTITLVDCYGFLGTINDTNTNATTGVHYIVDSCRFYSKFGADILIFGRTASVEIVNSSFLCSGSGALAIGTGRPQNDRIMSRGNFYKREGGATTVISCGSSTGIYTINDTFEVYGTQTVMFASSGSVYYRNVTILEDGTSTLPTFFASSPTKVNMNSGDTI